ncbi:DNA-binding GntR family transcriptional regulator [Bacilli bacterium PM5-3]|nr:DNA-binding GntR family transcriptional regulator [Bacilli bacterium PM5-3]MDH6603109.1 DNA-binding GntR family transcriptional regulator [Bacilli bacterium PM5-9]
MSQIKKSAKDLAYDYIKERIISGEYAPKEKIDDVRIAKELNISKTPIREAIQVLVSQNFLNSTPKIGTTVTEIDIKDIYQLYEPLATIQGLAARIACLSIKKENIEYLVDINERIANAIRRDDFLSAMELDKEFHNYILKIADNPYITSFSNDLIMQVQRIEFMFLTTITSFSKSIDEHNDLIKALQNKDEEQAEKMMENNWLTTIPDVNIKSLSRLMNSLK